MSAGSRSCPNAGLRADLNDKGRFDDAEPGLDIGPELRLGRLTLRQAAVSERFGDRFYPRGLGGDLDVTGRMTSEASFR